jgi:hypothetical protein
MLSLVYLIALSAVDVPATSTPTQAAATAKEKKICRREMKTGSMMPRSTCRTKAEWDAEVARSEANRELLGRRGKTTGVVNGSAAGMGN